MAGVVSLQRLPEPLFQKLQLKGTEIMVAVTQMYPSAYLKSADVPKRGQTLIIERLVQEELNSGETKWALYFQGEKRALILNKTNALNIAEKLGDDTARWVGKPVALQVVKVSFQGKLVDGIRVTPVDFDDDLTV
jgi:hypothetical protein